MLLSLPLVSAKQVYHVKVKLFNEIEPFHFRVRFPFRFPFHSNYYPCPYYAHWIENWKCHYIIPVYYEMQMHMYVCIGSGGSKIFVYFKDIIMYPLIV